MDKFCKDCRHYVNGDCREERNLKTDLVRGGMRARNSASFLREERDFCGPSGAWFQPIRRADRFQPIHNWRVG